MTDYDAFVRAQLPRLLRYSVMLTGERHLSADLVQDVLVKIYRHWSRISRTDRPDRYAIQMVTNQFLSWRRSWAVRNIVAVDEVPDRAQPGDLGTAHAARDDMWGRLAKLPKRQRAVLVLRYYEQFTDAEIAQVLGCSATTVRGHAHRALATLRVDLTNQLMAEAEEK
jgi:RNA polymerase sigma-70 factor (sigma-E family)